jgi:GNAT superfamily N-acetyltransferase
MNDQPTGNAAAESAAIEASYQAFFRLVATLVAGAEAHEDTESFRVMAGAMHPMMNSVVSTHLPADLSPESTREKIAAILAPFQARRLPLHWCIWPSTQPDDLGRHLQAYGLTNVGSSPGMTLDLAQPLPPLSPVEGLQIERVGDDVTLEQWLNVCLNGFGFSEHDQAIIRPAVRQLGYANPLFQYAGRLNGTAVATTSLLLKDGIAGISNVATLPEARQKGIGAAMILAALNDARAAGCQRAILTASAMGYPIYQRLGFREWCAVSEYIWNPDEDAGSQHSAD